MNLYFIYFIRSQQIDCIFFIVRNVFMFRGCLYIRHFNNLSITSVKYIIN